MSLVNYGSSSESESDNESTPQPQTKRSLSSMLPTPKKTVYVDLPKPADEEEDEAPKPKRVKTTTGLGLADLLPAPRFMGRPAAPIAKTTTNTPFVPLSLAKRMREKNKTKEEPKEKAETKEETETEQEETPTKHTGSFFHVGKALKEDPIIQASPKPIVKTTLGPINSVEKPPQEEEEEEEEEEGMTAVDAYAYDPNAMYSADPSTYYQYYQEPQAQSEQLEQLVGIRGESNVQIKTVNQSDILPSEEWREHHALTSAPKFNNGVTREANKLQKSKNNITALLAHAVNNQDKLDEMFAAQKKTRREAAKKYGF